MGTRVLTAPLVTALAVGVACALPARVHAEFPYAPQGKTPAEYSKYFLPPTAAVPDDLTGKRVWMYASTAEDGADALTRADRRELHGVRGAHVVDANRTAGQAWHTTTGRPDVTIAVLDSGIKWNDVGGMHDIRLKTRISTGEAPLPQADRADADAQETGASCTAYAARSGRDLNGDGVFNVLDYACDSRVSKAPANGVGPPDMLDPQDVLIAFSDGDDDDGNGYVDDMVGWDFLDDDNDPFDDVQYGHGTGEARDSAGEADNGGDLGTCPNCTEIHLRVGTSFIADVNRFALAVLYATDNGVSVVQEALGTLNKSRLGADAVRYAYEHGVVVIASAADEAAQHHNWPSSYPYGIVVNSVTHGDVEDVGTPSYLQFNGCTNFSSRITLAIPSVSCSSDATGRGAGMAGLVYSAALNAIESGRLEPHPTCVTTGGDPCPISANEVRQLMASGTVDGVELVDDVNFAQDPLLGTPTEISCRPIPTPVCTDPFLAAPNLRVTVPRSSYPARQGHDQFYGYGRVNMDKAVDAIVPAGTADARIPPEVEVTSPEWYEMVDPGRASMKVEGEVWARGATYSCRLYVAPGSYPRDVPAGAGGDFVAFPSPLCNGQPRTAPIDGPIADISIKDMKALFPATAGNFDGREPGTGEQIHGGRPNTEPYAFVVKVVAASGATTGEDRRQGYLHRDVDMLPGFPMQLPGDGEASPVLADIDGDNRNELVIANSDGLVYALERDGSQVPGFPVHTDVLPLHPDSRAFATGAVAEAYGAVIATPAVGDLDHDGTLEIVVADLEGKVYVFDGTGRKVDEWRTRIEYSGEPLAPFENVRQGRLNRTQHGFIGSPVLADVDGDDGGKLEIVAAAMDRHVYVWNHDGTDVDGWPVLVVDRSKVKAIDPVTHRVEFDPAKVPSQLDQGAIIDTPAVGNLAGDARPEIVVGTNESYKVDEGDEGPLNAGGLNAAIYAPLGEALEFANGRLFAIRPEGEPDADPGTGPAPWLPGWPFRVGILQAGVLPLVGEGITGSPVIGDVPCNGPSSAPRVGVIPAAGVPYLVDADGESCYGRSDGKDTGLPTEGGTATDQPFLPAFGHPAFGVLSGQASFLAPAAGLQRALDVVLPEYQGGHDYLVSWNTASGQVSPGWPVEVNDLQFLTGPSLADLDPRLPGDEVVSGTASDDLQGLSATGADLPGWPKLTGDWTVANPATGSFGTLDTETGAQKVVVGLTRSGRVLAYGSHAGACAAAAWPRFHHDNANSGDGRRDAVSPGRPAGAAMTGTTLRFTAPGDDLLCDTAAAYEVRTSMSPISARNFSAAEAVSVSGRPAAAGSAQALSLPADVGRYVAVRARDEQGNVGLPAVVDRGPAAGTPNGPPRSNARSKPNAPQAPPDSAGSGRGPVLLAP